MKIQAILLCSVSAMSIQGELIRTPIFRNHNPSHAFVSAKKRLEIVSKRGLDKRDGNSAPLYNDASSQYLVEVNIGTPAQKFTVTLDTGSADLWVPSTTCSVNQCPYDRFDPSKSSSFKVGNKNFSIQYGIGSANGTYATDTVSVGGATANDQQFGTATSTSDILVTASGKTSNNPVQGNGILGLGYPSLTQAATQGGGSYNPFMFNLVAQKVISQPVFSIYLNTYTKTGWSGELIIGGVDTSKFDGDLVYLPVVGLTSKSSGLFGSGRATYYYWMVYGTGIGVVNSSQGSNPSYTFAKTSSFILDTGTTLSYLPSEIAEKMVVSIAGPRGYKYDRSSGVYLVDCAAASNSAKLQLTMSQSAQANSNPVVLSVPAAQLVIPLDSSDIKTASTCMFGIAPNAGMGVGPNMYLIGDTVLRSAYMVYDMGNNRVGLAASKGVGGSITSSNTTSTDANTSPTSASNSLIASFSLTFVAFLWLLLVQ